MKTFIMIPTYNEKENIEKLINEIFSLEIDNLHIVVVDDDSPDYTWAIVRAMEKEDNRINLVHRKKKGGRASAGIDGFWYACQQNADYIIQMDADFSHNPKYLPEFIETLKDYDVVLGSRVIDGGKDLGRSMLRRFLTRSLNWTLRKFWGIPIKDPNSGFGGFRREVIKAIDISNTISTDFTVAQEWTYKSYLKGFKIKEIPVVFKEREHGESKMNTLYNLFKGQRIIMRLKWEHMRGRI
jgi:dolichol-phosphate mannosyltransferase